MASVKFDPFSPPQEIAPAAIYGHDGPVRLRIATGGAGQSGLLKALAEAFIDHYTVSTSSPPFTIAWIATDTSLSFNALATAAADVSIVYHPYAARIALSQGIADSPAYAWRDHFMLVGPKSNPASLPADQKSTVYELFALLFQACVSSQGSSTPVRFLSRYDKSANNIRESHFWSAIGQTPWAEPYSTWYHRYVEFPFGALRAASRLGEYALVDRGTWYSIEDEVRKEMMVFKEAMDAEEGDALLNPAIVLRGVRAREGELAANFVEWLASREGGQRVIGGFEVGGVVLHSVAPAGVDVLKGTSFVSKV